MKKPKAIIVDLDGTISDHTHRKHLVESNGAKDFKRDFETYFSKLGEDPLNTKVYDKVKQMSVDHKVLILTSRPEHLRKPTEEWLSKHKVPYDIIYMRQDSDRRPAEQVKEETFDTLIQPMYSTVKVFDDNHKVCSMFENKGISVQRC